MAYFRINFCFVCLVLFFVFSAIHCYSETEREDPLLIEDLKAIVVFGNSDNRILTGEHKIDDGEIQFIDLEIPGRSADLKNLLYPFLNHPMTIKTLGMIKRVITDYYLSKQHPFVIVKIPKQEVTEGVLAIVVVSSELGQLTVEGNQWTSSGRMKSYMGAEPRKPIDESRYIQNVSFINRNPFRRADLVFVPGEREGTTDIVLSMKDRRPLRIYAGSDNTGVDLVGDDRWYAGFNWGNAFSLDHILSYQSTNSYVLNVFQSHTLDYTAPLPWRHLLNIYGGYSEVHPHVQAPVKSNDGWSMQVSGRYVVPLKIYTHLEHEITVGGDFKRSNNTFEFTEQLPLFGRNVNLTQLILGYSGNYETNNTRIDFRGDLFYSPGRWLQDQTNADYDSLRPGAVNHWVYFRCSMNYLQRLPKSCSFLMIVAGQVSSAPLLPSEQFGLGGYDTVRGYEQREVNKDTAAFVVLEMRSPAFPLVKQFKPSLKLADGLQFLVFLDSGFGTNIDRIPTTRKADYLIGIGPGFRYTLEPYLTVRLDWGIRLHNNAEFEGSWNKLHFGVTASY